VTDGTLVEVVHRSRDAIREFLFWETPCARSPPAPGTGENTQRVRAARQKELMAHFNQHKRYPANGSLHSADILVNFVLDEDGRLFSSAIVRGSGDGSFDEAARCTTRGGGLGTGSDRRIIASAVSFTLPVTFRVKRVN
jgi:periplasmic protein TonB